MSIHLSPGELAAVFLGCFVGLGVGSVVGAREPFVIGFGLVALFGYIAYERTGGDESADADDRDYEAARRASGGGSLLPEDRSYDEPEELGEEKAHSPED